MTNYAIGSELGKKTVYEASYNPDKLFPIARQTKREELGLYNYVPFYGVDIWNHYEVSWLNQKGKPVVALAEIIYDCRSINIIESKSMKLYFNTFNNSKFPDFKAVESCIRKDISEKIHAPVFVKVIPLDSIDDSTLHARLQGQCIDALDIECDCYQTNPDFLQIENEVVTETVYSDLLKSNCLITDQPDWCSVQISYSGNKINHESLLRYLVSFRNSNEFHEQCLEKIFMHLLERCQPKSLTVYGRSTRRGGIDINSYRSTEELRGSVLNPRLCRQ